MANNALSVKTYNACAEAYAEKFINFDLYNDTYNVFLSLITKSFARILELGCGPGNVTSYLLNKRPDLQYSAFDLSPEMIQLAKQNVPTARFYVHDIRHLSSIFHVYDGIIAAFSVPYLSYDETTQLIYEIHRLSRRGTLIYLSCMEDDPKKSGLETTSFSDEKPVYIYYYTEKFIKQVLEKYNIKITHTFKKKYPQTDGTFLTDLIFIAQQN